MDAGQIRAFRKRLGLTQEQLAKLLGVHTLTVSRWERGQVTPDGATAQLLDLLNERSEHAKPDSETLNKILGFIAAGTAIAGLGALLAYLFSRDAGGEE